MSIDKQKNFNCVAAAEHLHEYLDGELQPDLRAAMEQHLVSCADCSATLAQLRQIETAHQQLDARLESPAEEYWQALPQRVMDKVKASEKRRLLALPKLPRLKSPVKRAPVNEPALKPDLLYLTPALQKFLRGPAKYVLPLAAVAAFCFFMIGELREKPAASIMTASAPEQPKAEAQSAREESLLEKSNVSEPAPMAEAPTQKSVLGPRTALKRADEKIVLSRDTLLASANQVAGAGQDLDVSAPAGGAFKADAPKPISLSEAQPQAAEADIVSPELRQAQTFVATGSKAKDQPAAPLEKEVRYRAENLKTETAKTADDQLAQAAESRAKKISTAGRMGVSSSAAMRTVENINESRYHQTLQSAQQTTDLKKREKIWRDFLKSNPDSSLRAIATVDLARTLAAASDSTTKPEQLEKTLAFFRDNAAVLRPQMGAQEFDREVARLRMLLNFRRPASTPK
jgi:anti-sigma factor RsiW